MTQATTKRWLEAFMWLCLVGAVLALCLVGAGCGGDAYTDDDETVEPEIAPEPEPEIGQAESELSTHWYYAYNTSGTGNYRCQQYFMGGLASDVCIYPDDKARRICTVGIGMTAAQKTEAEADIDALLPGLNSQFGSGGWQFTRGCGTGDDVSVEYGNIPGAQAKTSILGYVKITTPATTLANPSGFNGTHKRQTGTAVLRIDRPQIVADFLAADVQRVRRHALYGGLFAAAAGLGFTPDNINTVTAITITSGAAKSTTVSAAEKCRVNNYDPNANPGTLVQSNSPACDSAM